jgi:predicted HicB family RNase H-like nuclease
MDNKKPIKRVMLAVRLPPKTHEAVTSAAKRQRVCRTYWVEDALDRKLKGAK